MGDLIRAINPDGNVQALTCDADGNLHTTATIAGDVNVSASTEYTEDAAAIANPVGGVLMLVRTDIPATNTVTADNDNIAARATSKGEMYVKHIDTLNISDGAGSITVDGTLAVTQSGTWDEIGINDSGNSITVDDGGGNISIDDGGNSITVDGTVTVTGVATAAKQDTQTTSLQLIDDPIATISATPLMRVAIFDAADAQITTFGGGTQYTEDAVATANPIGTAPILVRTDTPGTLVSNDGDYVAARGTNYGAAYVTLLDSAGGTPSIGGGTQYTEDAVAAANPIGNALIMVRADSLSGSLVTTDGDNVAARGNNKGELYVKHTDAIPITDNSGSLTVDNAGTFAVQVSSATPAGTNVIGKIRLVSTDGTEVTDDTASAVMVLNVDAAGSPINSNADRLTDNIGVALQTDVILNDTTALTPKFVYATVAASQTDQSIIAAVSSKKLRILSAAVMCGGTATDITFESDGGSDTALHKITGGANGGQVLGFNPVGWFQTLSGEALIATTGAGSTYQITLCYVEV